MGVFFVGAPHFVFAGPWRGGGGGGWLKLQSVQEIYEINERVIFEGLYRTIQEVSEENILEQTVKREKTHRIPN